MIIKFVTLTLHNFKSHQDLTVNFGESTEITGDNGLGKSSIGEALTWLLYSVDLMGSTKFDPTPITYEAEDTKVSLLLEIDGKNVLLGKTLKKGKASCYVNEVPTKATEYIQTVEKLFDKELFLALFNPFYFPSLKWDKQRAMILQYVTAPANKEVLKHMPERQSEELATLFKKHSLADIEKIYREKKVKLEKNHIAAESKSKTLKEQLENNGPTAPRDSLKVELDQLKKERDSIKTVLDSAEAKNNQYYSLENQAKQLLSEIDSKRNSFNRVKETKIKSECETCKQPLDEESRKAIKESRKEKLLTIQGEAKQLMKRRSEIIQQLNTMETVDTMEQIDKLNEIQQKMNPIERELMKYKELEYLQEDFEASQNKEAEILKELNYSIFIIDSVKDFKAKEAEVQAEKVQALFDKLTIKLTEKQKNGEIKNTFEIELDGKPYRKLSLSESIRAGLELRDVLSQQSEVIAPCFIDNGESITSFKEPIGQLILSRVVAGQELKIKGVEK